MISQALLDVLKQSTIFGAMDRRSFEDALRAAFRTDDVDTVLAGWTPLGHYEQQRKRARLPLHEVLE